MSYKIYTVEELILIIINEFVHISSIKVFACNGLDLQYTSLSLILRYSLIEAILLAI